MSSRDVELDTIILEGLDCADCAQKLETKVSSLNGVKSARINFAASTMKVEHTVSISEIMKIIQKTGYHAVLKKDAGLEERSKGFFSKKNYRLMSTFFSGVFLLLGALTSFFNIDVLTLPFYIAAVIIGGYYPAKAGYYSLRSGLVLDMNVLMTLAVIGAAAISEWVEAATVIFLFSLGNTLESYTMAKIRHSIKELMDLVSREARVLKEDGEIALPVEEIQPGDVVVIRPGEKIPIDGEIIAGSASINQAPITGEAIPVSKKEGDEVFAGTVNENGYLKIKTTKLVGDTTLAKIIAMVEEAQEQKAPSQRFVDVFAKYYTPLVIGLAVFCAVVPPLLFNQSGSEWFYRALTLLVVFCPCALVISTPVSIVSAIGNAAKNGVLIKGGAYLEQAGSIKAVAFDKTGTLTEGKPEVTDIVALDAADEREVLQIAAALEQGSEHHLAKAILRKAEKLGLEYSPAADFQVLTGQGVQGSIAGCNYYAASPHFFLKQIKQDKARILQEKVEKLQNQAKTVVVIGTVENLLGIIAITDSVRKNSKETIEKLHNSGIKTIMLTGDNERAARAFADELGIDEYKAELFPEDKVNSVKELQKQYGHVAMVGDGINDAPALVAATIGVAMGGAGTDTALETADIVLMADDLEKLPFTMRLSRRALNIIKQNITFAIAIKIIAVLLVLPGVLNLWLAILADTGASLAVIANGMRLLKIK